MEISTAYPALKTIHVTAAVVTISGFVLRGIWMFAGSAWLQRRPVRILPHVVDAVFLLSGIGLILALELPLMQQPWLLAKLAAIVLYVLLGTITLKRGRTMKIRATAFAAALSTFAYIVGVALYRSPASWFA